MHRGLARCLTELNQDAKACANQHAHVQVQQCDDKMVLEDTEDQSRTQRVNMFLDWPRRFPLHSCRTTVYRAYSMTGPHRTHLQRK